MNHPADAQSESSAYLNQWREVTPGENFAIRASVQDTEGRYTAIELTAEPRNGVPVHIHSREEEHFVVIEGRVRLMNGAEFLTLSAGQSATVQRGTPHAWSNPYDAMLRMLVIFSPGHSEETFRLIGSADAGDLAAIEDAARRGGSRVIGPPPFEDIYSVMSPRPKS
ncbi:cupin domain-containing protein [Rhizobium sp. YIM 134829]|uniref:cupin domain-containing protein n=1 Tax=Rhizobium sp. YIM 134829 TaxID=3390453 RepID=UPI00397BC2DC